MINLIEKLKELGLTEYESKSYLSLIENGVETGNEVAKTSGVPQTRVFSSLHNLVEMGLVTKIKQRPMLFKPVDPKIGIKKLISKKMDVLKESEKSVRL